ncbi:hypothetical protein Syun_016861 [Stephania yunnanensis]|uniref:Uncharacterized protein n=1 Tax=Stephania yunnanensis TaxID=152371 RepID=A0AAP0P2U1_9MAGN
MGDTIGRKPIIKFLFNNYFLVKCLSNLLLSPICFFSLDLHDKLADSNLLNCGGIEKEWI